MTPSLSEVLRLAAELLVLKHSFTQKSREKHQAPPAAVLS